MKHTFVVFVTLLIPAFAKADAITLTPSNATLRGKDARQRLVVTLMKAGKASDVTRGARFESLTPKILTVNDEGVVTPAGNGEGTIVARLDGMEARATIDVIDGEKHLPVTFDRDVQPILARFGCNA